MIRKPGNFWTEAMKLRLVTRAERRTVAFILQLLNSANS
jgi:hypothetical protein